MKTSLQSYLGIRGSLTCFRSLKMNFFRSGVSCFIQAIVACNNKEVENEKVKVSINCG